MPFNLIPWKWIGIGLAALSIIAGAYFAVTKYDQTMKENAQLQIQNKTLMAQKDQIKHDYDQVIQTVNQNDNVTKQVTEHTTQVIQQIKSVPIQTNCVQSPAVGIALKQLEAVK